MAHTPARALARGLKISRIPASGKSVEKVELGTFWPRADRRVRRKG